MSRLQRPRQVFARSHLSQITNPADTSQTLAKATVQNIHSDGTVDLQMPDGLRENVECGDWYTPSVGDGVRVIRADPFSLFVLGATLKSADTTVDVANRVGITYNVLAADSGPGGTTGTSTFLATATRSYRSMTGWERADVYQGAYSASYTYWYGCYFYGTAPQALKGRTVTSATIRIHRKATGGNSANVPQYIAPHAHLSQPSSAPYFTAAARNLGVVDWGQALDLTLPASWAQALINGDAKVRGFGHRIAATGGYYSINYSKASDTYTGRLTIHWKT